MSFFKQISTGLSKTRDALAKTFSEVFSLGQGREELELLEEFLILADVGPAATATIIHAAEERPRGQELFAAVRETLIDLLSVEQEEAEGKIKIIVGINGSGKTTSVGKLCYRLQQERKSSYVIGTDTFRAAADMQLEEWCRRTGTPCLMGKSGSDPAAVLFDGLNSSAAKAADVIICDTAGRLHVNKNLMQELHKIVRVANKFCPSSVDVYLTLDAGTGQNALAQAAIFQEWVQPSGIVLTKLDGSAKGGVAIALVGEYQIPIKYIGIGEGLDDLIPFDAASYVDSLMPELREPPL